MVQPATPRRPCRRCKDHDAVLAMRTDYVCSGCYCRFIHTKTVKRLEVLNRDAKATHRRPPMLGSGGSRASALASKTFLVGLSFGPSSAALVDICEQIILGQLAKGRDAAFTLHVVHVDTQLGRDDADVQVLLDRWRARYPRFVFERLPLTDALALSGLDWSLLCPGPSLDDDAARPDPAALRPADRLRVMLGRLPSAAARCDVLGLLVRRLLVARAVAARCDALLLGCSTTALAERTLAETAKGRGFAVPWQTSDGPVGPAGDGGGDDGSGMLLYYPLRELFRKELVKYTSLTQPSLEDLIEQPPPSATTGASVVSHKDLSIEEVMTRYFAEVEESYPSIVANVVRTAGKLERRGLAGSEARADESCEAPIRSSSCGVCDMPLDEVGNERWRGEIGDLDSPRGGLDQRPPNGRRLCYGCERSIHG